MPLAEWSRKTAVEYEQNVHLTAKIGQAKWLALEIVQGEIGGKGIKNDLRHWIFPPRIVSGLRSKNTVTKVTFYGTKGCLGYRSGQALTESSEIRQCCRMSTGQPTGLEMLPA